MTQSDYNNVIQAKKQVFTYYTRKPTKGIALFRSAVLFETQIQAEFNSF